MMAATATPVMKTKLVEWGTSQGVRIPKRMCESVGLSLGGELSMSVGTDAQGSFVVIRPQRALHRSFADVPYISMDEIFKDYTGDYIPVEADWGDDVGLEVVM